MGPLNKDTSNMLGQQAQRVFYVLMETPCPYLDGRQERKLLTELAGERILADYSLLSRAGFRRSHRFAYRPACRDCDACVPVRVVASEFDASRSLKRVQRMNAGLVIEERPAKATSEQYGVFHRYIRSRHGDGDMANMGYDDYRAMVEDSRLDTRMLEFRDAENRLVAACLADWLEDGPSAVYSFFEPDLSRLSLGNYMVLALIDAARRDKLPYVYLGYWIAQSLKMAYKKRFQPIEGLGPDGWSRLPADDWSSPENMVEPEP